MASLFSKMTLRTVGAGAAVLNFMSLDHTVADEIMGGQVAIGAGSSLSEAALDLLAADQIHDAAQYGLEAADKMYDATKSGLKAADQIHDASEYGLDQVDDLLEDAEGKVKLFVPAPQKMDIEARVSMNIPKDENDLMQNVDLTWVLTKSMQNVLYSDHYDTVFSPATIMTVTRIEIVASSRALSGRRLIADHLQESTLAITYSVVTPDEATASSIHRTATTDAEGFCSALLTSMNNEIQNQPFLVASEFAAVSVPSVHSSYAALSVPADAVPQKMQIEVGASMNMPNGADFRPPEFFMESGDELIQVEGMKSMLTDSLENTLYWYSQGAISLSVTVARIEVVSSSDAGSGSVSSTLVITYSLETPDEDTALAVKRTMEGDVGGFCSALMISMNNEMQNHSFLAGSPGNPAFVVVAVPSDGLDSSYAAAEDALDWAGGQLDDAVKRAKNYSAHHVEEEESNVGVLIAIIAGGVVVLGLIIVGLCCACAAGQKGTNHVAGAGLSTTAASASTAPVVQVNMAIPPPQQVQMESVV